MNADILYVVQIAKATSDVLWITGNGFRYMRNSDAQATSKPNRGVMYAK